MCARVQVQQSLQVGEEAVQRDGLADEGGYRMAQGGGAVGRVAVVGDAGDERDAAQVVVPREEGEEAPTQRTGVVGDVEDDGGGGEGAQDLVRADAEAECTGLVAGVGQDVAQEGEERLIVVEDGDARGQGGGPGHRAILSWRVDRAQGGPRAREGLRHL